MSLNGLLTPLSFLSAQGLLTTEIDGGKFQWITENFLIDLLHYEMVQKLLHTLFNESSHYPSPLPQISYNTLKILYLQHIG